MRARVPRSRVTHDRWLVSYADFITLLFAFFVVLYSSAMQQKKQAQISDSIESAFRSLGIFGSLSRHDAQSTDAHTAATAEISLHEEIRSPARVKEDLRAMQNELQQQLSGEVGRGAVTIKMGRDGLVISLREAGFFDSGSARPHPDALSVLHRISDALSRSAYNVRVEGHTDNVPIHNAEFDSNWELSGARASAVARLLLGMGALPPDRISAAGYAEFHPVDSNATAAGRANNRRVDLVIMPRSHLDLSAFAEGGGSGPWRKITDDDSPSK